MIYEVCKIVLLVCFTTAAVFTTAVFIYGSVQFLRGK